MPYVSTPYASFFKKVLLRKSLIVKDLGSSELRKSLVANGLRNLIDQKGK